MKLNSVRTKEALKKVFSVLLVVILVAAIVAVCIYFYLQRYVVYTPDGIVMDMKSYPISQEAEVSPTPPRPAVSGELVVEEPLINDENVDPSLLSQLEQLNAVYITYDEMLDIPALEAKLAELEYTALVIRVKRDHGSMIFPSASGNSEGDTTAVTQFLTRQTEKGVYLAAQLCCFRDDLYALDNQSEGLPISGGALWVDSDNYYWMSPTSSTALEYVITLGKELYKLGFSEVILENFCYPTSGSTSSIVYSDADSGSKTDNISAGATTVTTRLSSAGLRVSLLCSASTCKAMADSAAGYDMAVLSRIFDRIYVELEAGSDVKGVVDGLKTASGSRIQMMNWLVFITGSNDTRFADYGIAKKN